jgi:DNA-binding PadR family transcriptional regulator
MTRQLSALEFAVLGLLAESPKSGYDIRRVFGTTAMRLYSDSPGSIYPALRRLERRKLIVAHRLRTGRRRTTYVLSPRGQASARRWLVAPVTEADVSRHDGSLELKLAFMSSFLPERLPSFLDEWSAAVATLTHEAAHNRRVWRRQLPLSGELALELGYRTLRSRSAALRRARARVTDD